MVSGCQPSNTSLEVIEVDPSGGWTSLNFISAATFKSPTPSVDQHSMWIYEVDGQFIEPIQYDSFTIRAGERYSVMIKLDQKPQDYPIRISDLNSQLFSAVAILRYKNSPWNLQITEEQFITYRGEQTAPWLDYNCELLNNATILNRFLDITNYKPFPSSDLSLKPAIPTPEDQQFIFHVTRVNVSWQTTMNFPYLYPIDNDAYKPLLYQPNATEGYDPRYVIRTKNNTWVDLIVQVGEYEWWPVDFPHTMHKHSSKTWLIGVSNGVYNYSSVYEALQANPSSFNLENPGYRDTWANEFVGAQWIVMRYHVTNPGPFLFHCHIETHLAAGMGLAILDGVDAWPYIPPEYGVTQHGLKPPRVVKREVNSQHFNG
jgi:FtsP/CotA-like multicopper oxidase with cupredoxin domain